MDSAAFEEHIRNEGIYQGEIIKLIDQICRKLQKEKTLEQIADELEEPLEIVERCVPHIRGKICHFTLEKEQSGRKPEEQYN